MRLLGGDRVVRVNLKEDFAEAWRLTLSEIQWLFILSLFNLIIEVMPPEIHQALGSWAWGIIVMAVNLALFFFFLLDVRNAVVRGGYKETWEAARHFGWRYGLLSAILTAGGLSAFLSLGAARLGWLGAIGPLFFAYSVPALLIEDVGFLQAVWRSMVFSARNFVEHVLLLIFLAAVGVLVAAVAGPLGMAGGLLLGLYSAFATIVFFVFYSNRVRLMPEIQKRWWILW